MILSFLNGSDHRANQGWCSVKLDFDIILRAYSGRIGAVSNPTEHSVDEAKRM